MKSSMAHVCGVEFLALASPGRLHALDVVQPPRGISTRKTGHAS